MNAAMDVAETDQCHSFLVASFQNFEFAMLSDSASTVILATVGAIEPLTKYIETTEDGEGLFFLPMSHHQVGNEAEAKVYFYDAVTWIKDRKDQKPSLKRLQSEAAELMGIARGDTNLGPSTVVDPAKTNSIQ
jgi:hypothetical protein